MPKHKRRKEVFFCRKLRTVDCTELQLDLLDYIYITICIPNTFKIN